MSGLTWLGHSTVVVDLDGTLLITDPILRRRVWHLRRDAAVENEALGRLDAVLVSHAHFDHLDLRSLDRFDRGLPIVVPRGVGALVGRRGFGRTVELEAGDELELGAVRVRATHAEHVSRRGPLWTRTPSLGYVVEGAASVYFAGDTELFAGMSDLRPVDVALLPVSGWGPRLGPGHLDPAGAAEALRLLQPKAALPIHWGTLRTPFAEHPDDRPAREFARLAGEVAPDVEIFQLAIGETLPFEAVSGQRSSSSRM